jgi:hypothetical protein
MGAKAARAAARDAQTAGLIVTGTIDVYEGDQAASMLAQLHPTGTVRFVRKAAHASPEERPTKTKRGSGKAAD